MRRPPSKKRPDRRVGLEALEFLERAQIRVVVIEPDDEPDRHLPAFEMVEERAAIGAVVERPADRVHDEAGLMLLRRRSPTIP